jgi:hypothetical protein
MIYKTYKEYFHILDPLAAFPLPCRMRWGACWSVLSLPALLPGIGNRGAHHNTTPASWAGFHHGRSPSGTAVRIAMVELRSWGAKAGLMLVYRPIRGGDMRNPLPCPLCEPPPPCNWRRWAPSQRVRVILYGTRCDQWFGPHCRYNLDLAVAVF